MCVTGWSTMASSLSVHIDVDGNHRLARTAENLDDTGLVHRFCIREFQKTATGSDLTYFVTVQQIKF